jgi:hypothetical protein
MKIEVLNPIALMNGWMIMIKSLRVGNVHYVIILEGANFTNGCKTHYKNQETQVGWICISPLFWVLLLFGI